MNSVMSQKYEKLKALLKQLFQLDQPDLDFGLYRVMHVKSAEVSQFLDRDLLPQVQAALGQYRNADKAELEKELAKVVAGIETAGMNPDDSPKVKNLRTRLKSDAVDVGALESEVYDHLFSFFRRYYSEGDFLAKRVTSRESTPSPTRARRSCSTGQTRISTTSRPASTCATTPSVYARTTTTSQCACTSG